MRKRCRTARTTTLGTSLTFTETRVEGAPRGAGRAYVVRAQDRRWVLRIDTHERRWRIDVLDFIVSTVGVPGYFATPELAAGVLEIALVRGADRPMTEADVRAAIVEVRSGRTVAECHPVFDVGTVGLRATL